MDYGWRQLGSPRGVYPRHGGLWNRHRRGSWKNTIVTRPRFVLSSAAVLLLVTLILRVPGWFPSLIDPDEAVFSLAAREVLKGHLPYTSMYDNKPVGSTLIFAAFFAVMGPSILAARIVGAAAAFASGVLVCALACEYDLRRRIALAAGALQIVYVSALGLGGQATMTELLATPFTISVALAFRKLERATQSGKRIRFAISGGFACGVAVLIKIVPILPGCAIAGTILLLGTLRGRFSRYSAAGYFAVFIAAAFVPMAVTATVFARANEFDPFLYSNFGFAAAYIRTYPQISTIAQRLGTVVDQVWPLLVFAGIAISRPIFFKRRYSAEIDSAIVMLAWVIAEAFSASLSLKFYTHYFIGAVAPLIMLAVEGFRAISLWVGARSETRVKLFLILFLAAISFEHTQIDFIRRRLYGPDVPRAVAKAILQKTHGRIPSIFVTNYELSGIYLLTGAALPNSRYIIPFHLFTKGGVLAGVNLQSELSLVLREAPEFIVFDDEKALPGWATPHFANVQWRYRLFFKQGTVRVFRRVV